MEVRGFLAKAAEGPHNPILTVDRNALVSKGLSDVGKVMLAAGGAGLAYRLIQGLPSLFGRPRPELGSDQAPALLEIPHPVYANRSDRGPAKRRRIPGAAGTAVRPIEAVGVKAANSGGSPMANLLGLTKDPFDASPTSTGDWLRGQGANPNSVFGKAQIPWYIPGVALGGLGAAVAGYKGMDWLLNKKRKMDLNAELDDAKAEYQQALIDMYDPNRVKLLKAGSAADALNRDLDALAGLVVGREKKADETWTEWAGRQAGRFLPTGIGDRVSSFASSAGGAGLGAYAALAGLIGVGTGAMSYAHHMQNDPSAALAAAVKQRERERWAKRPPEVFAVPVGVKNVGGRIEETAPAVEE